MTSERDSGAQAPLFTLGRVVATPGALAQLQAHGISAWGLVRRHQRLDGGALCQEDQQLNRQALVEGGRLLSKYALPDGEGIYLITEADRSVTTLLLPGEY
jgi:hypothetical protein